MIWVTKSQSLGSSLFGRALRSRVMVVVHLHHISGISPLPLHTTQPTHTPTGLTWKRGIWMFLNSKRILKGILTAPCTTAATPSAEIHPIRGGLSGVLLNALEQARQVRSALDLSTRKLEVAYQLPLIFARPEWQIRSAEDACLPLECSKAPLPLSSQT